MQLLSQTIPNKIHIQTQLFLAKFLHQLVNIKVVIPFRAMTSKWSATFFTHSNINLFIINRIN